MARVRSHRLAAVAALAAAALAVPRGAAACSVCLAGDPNFSTQGAQAQEAGSVSVYLEVRGYEKRSGRDRGAQHDDAVASAPEPTSSAPAGGGAGSAGAGHANHEHEEEPPPAAPGEEVAADAEGASEGGHDHGGREKHASQRVDLYASWTPVDRVTITGNVPFVANDVRETEDGTSTHLSLAGLGDASLGVSGVVWRNRPALPSTWVEVRGWVKAPTGPSEQRVDGVADAHVQTGTGSWDFGWGLAGVHRFEWGSLYTSTFHRINTEGGYDYEYGDVALATIAVEVPLGHALGRPALDRLTPGFGFDFRFAGRDHQDGEGVEDTGGAVLYATPTLRIALPSFRETQRAWIRTGVQIPLGDAWLYDRQDEGPVWSVGLGTSF